MFGALLEWFRDLDTNNTGEDVFENL
jgi:hypothetical protein